MIKYLGARTFLGTLTLLIGLAQVFDARAQVPSLPGNSGRFAYLFDCAGQYLRVDLATHNVSQPQVVPGIAAGMGGFDGCLVKAVAVEPESSVVYVVMSKQRLVDSLGKIKTRWWHWNYRLYEYLAAWISTTN